MGLVCRYSIVGTRLLDECVRGPTRHPQEASPGNHRRTGSVCMHIVIRGVPERYSPYPTPAETRRPGSPLARTGEGRG